jgi:hypothetical protein
MIFRHPRAHEKYNIVDAVAYFREQGLQPGFINRPCRYCKKPDSLRFQRIDVDDRIELKIGAFRIALCIECAAFQVVYARRAAQKKNRGLFNESDFKNWSKENFGV